MIDRQPVVQKALAGLARLAELSGESRVRVHVPQRRALWPRKQRDETQSTVRVDPEHQVLGSQSCGPSTTARWAGAMRSSRPLSGMPALTVLNNCQVDDHPIEYRQ